MTSSTSITSSEFKEALSRYPALIMKIAGDEKPGLITLEELDQFRYIEAPASFSKQTGRVLAAADVQKLMAWKLRHGKWRPSLTKLVAGNSDETIADATKKAFDHYASNPSDISGTLNLLAAPLKGIGPATASLLLSVHDPKNIIFFSDEAYRWLVAGDSKFSLKYNVKEYEAVHEKAQALATKLDATPIEIEQVAFVIIKENEPVKEPAAPYVPTGKPRGRPALPESEKKQKPAPSGRGRGRPALPESEKKQKPVSVPGRGRGRPKGSGEAKPKAAPKVEKTDNSAAPANKRGRPAKSEDALVAKKPGRPPKTEDSLTAKKQGRPAKGDDTPTAKKRGRPSLAQSEDAATPAKKRGRPSLAAQSEGVPSAKKRGRPSLVKSEDAATPAKKRGRPSLAAQSEGVPSAKKRGRPSLAQSEDLPSAKKTRTA